MNKFLYCLKKQNLEYFSTLKETSYDKDNKIYLCNNTTEEVIDFDELIKKRYPKKQPSSVDAILTYPLEREIKLYLIEFKNQITAKIDNQEIRKKLTNSIDTLKDIFSKCNISFNSTKLFYCVVYKKQTSTWMDKIKENVIRFGLEEFEGQLVDGIFTNDVERMREKYNKIFQKKLNC